MGLINHSEYIFQTGLSLQDTYICISSNLVRLNKLNINNYQIVFTYTIFFNEQSKLNNRQYLDMLTHTFTTSDLNTNIYVQCYNELKSIYPNYSDV